MLAIVAAAVLNWMTPESLTAGPGWVPVVVIVLLNMAVMLRPQWHDQLGYVKAGIATAVLAYALTSLVRDMVRHHGRLDEGGPHCRSRRQVYCGGAFLFPQLSLPPEVRKDIGATEWKPQFIDYLFVAFNTSTALSPTDVPVLSRWAKVLLMIQSSISLTTLAIVAARAVNIL